MYNAILFDFDGTLLDSFRYSFKHLEYVAQQHGFAITPEVKLQMLRTWGHSGREFLH